MIRFALMALLAIVLAVPAQACGTLPGGGGFYSGALHPLVALEHFLAGGLILGRDGLRRPLGVGLVAGPWLGVALAGLTVVLLAVTLGLGWWLALRLTCPR